MKLGEVRRKEYLRRYRSILVCYKNYMVKKMKVCLKLRNLGRYQNEDNKNSWRVSDN